MTKKEKWSSFYFANIKFMFGCLDDFAIKEHLTCNHSSSFDDFPY